MYHLQHALLVHSLSLVHSSRSSNCAAAEAPPLSFLSRPPHRQTSPLSLPLLTHSSPSTIGPPANNNNSNDNDISVSSWFEKRTQCHHRYLRHTIHRRTLVVRSLLRLPTTQLPITMLRLHPTAVVPAVAMALAVAVAISPSHRTPIHPVPTAAAMAARPPCSHLPCRYRMAARTPTSLRCRTPTSRPAQRGAHKVVRVMARRMARARAPVARRTTTPTLKPTTFQRPRTITISEAPTRRTVSLAASSAAVDRATLISSDRSLFETYSRSCALSCCSWSPSRASSTSRRAFDTSSWHGRFRSGSRRSSRSSSS